MTANDRSIEEIRSDIAAITLEDINLELAATALPDIPDYKVDVPQVVTVGSQIAEFAKDVPAELRSAIANSFLLAQLAADKWVKDHLSSDKAWYNCYIATLKKCGWLVERDETALRSVSGDGLKVHQEIIGVLATVLGPAASAVSIVLGVLNGLKAMENDQPFFTIFDRASQHAEAQLFQISYVDLGPDKSPRINIAAYRIEANASATQILFFKLVGANAQLLTSSADLSINESVLNQIQGAIAVKVGDRIAGNVTNIEI